MKKPANKVSSIGNDVIIYGFRYIIYDLQQEKSRFFNGFRQECSKTLDLHWKYIKTHLEFKEGKKIENYNMAIKAEWRLRPREKKKL